MTFGWLICASYFNEPFMEIKSYLIKTIDDDCLTQSCGSRQGNKVAFENQAELMFLDGKLCFGGWLEDDFWFSGRANGDTHEG